MSNHAEAIGFTHFWGFAPPINLINQPIQQQEFNILLSGTSDLRYIFETCLHNFKQQGLKLNFYIHEKSKEVVCRQLLLLLVMHICNISCKDRSEIYLEIFGNAYLREQIQSYIDKLIPFLDDLISKESKFQSALNQIIDLRELKFKDRDEMVDVIRSWYSYQEFKMDQLFDTRLRHHYGSRYDFRLNLIDWDYQMNLKEYAPIIHFYHYRQWRQNGIAFESRFSSYPTPNRTLSSYLPGKDKKTRDSLLVRGYWGDITISPYISVGIKCSIEPEKTELFKIRNQQQVSHAVTVAEFNYQHMIEKFESLKDYHLDFEELLGKSKQKDEKQQLSQIEEKQEEEENQENQEQQFINQGNFVEVKTKDEVIIQISKDPLQVFKDLNLTIIPIFEEYEKLYQKKKFQNFFDIGVIGFMESLHVKNKELKQLFKQQGKLYVETAKYIVPFSKEEREKASKNLEDLGIQGGWTFDKQSTSEHHTFYNK